MTDYSALDDESLLLAIREGNEEARSVLAIRYYQRRFVHGNAVAPATYRMIDPCDYGSLYFRVYLACENHYTFGEHRFVSYFQMALKHQIQKEVEQIIATRQKDHLARFCPIHGHDDSMLSLHDVVAPDQDPHDPRIYLNYCETLEKIRKLPKQVSPKVLRLVDLHLSGLSYDEAAAKLRMPPRTAKTMLGRYRKFVRGLIKHDNRPAMRPLKNV
jgi:hypothetical protein